MSPQAPHRDCLTDSELRAYLADDLARTSHQPSAATPYPPASTASEADSASQHTASMPAAQNSSSSLYLQAPPASRDEVGEKSGLDAESRDAAELHLSECARCRGRLVSAFDHQEEDRVPEDARVPEEVLEAVRRAPFEDRPTIDVRWVARAAVFAVLVLGLAIGMRMADDPRRAGDPDRAMRSGANVSVPLELDLPTTVSATDLTFRWRSSEPASRYTVSVTDPSGDLVLRETVTDTRWTPEPDRLSVPGSYFWYVTAYLDNGEVVESEIHELELVDTSGDEPDVP